MTLEIILGSLTFVACVSPLLTLIALWQIKEWRFDRLNEHLMQQGILQLFGKVRSIIVVTSMVLLYLLIFTPFGSWEVIISLATLPALLCIGISVVQLLKHSHRIPTWTLKVLMIFLGALLLDAILIAWLIHSLSISGLMMSLLLIPLQFLIVMIVKTLLQPFDWFLKHRLLSEAKRLRSLQPHLTVIGITGSVGKTTTKELLAHILKNRGALATPLHVNTELGVSKWLIALLKKEPTESERILIIEMGAYRKREIALLSEITRPSLGIITAVGRQHLALFGSPEMIVEAKGELFEALPESGHAFGNKDNSAFDALKIKCRCPLTSVGTAKGADVQALDIEETGTGIRFSLEGTTFSVPLFGTHTVTSVLFAIAVAKHLQVPVAEIAETLRTFQGMKQTFEVKNMNGITVLDDTYNASPESFRAAIEWAARQPHKRKILVTEGIIELGKDEESIHRELAREAAGVFDRIFVTHERTLPYFRDVFGERAELTTEATPLAPGDLLVCIGRVAARTIDRFLKK